MASTPMPSDTTIAEAALKVLKEQNGPIYLSRLGQDLRKEFGAAFKETLGNRSLGDLVVEHWGDQYEVWGKGPHKRVGVVGSAKDDTEPKPRQKFIDEVWEAFSSPISEGLTRWIDLGPPVAISENRTKPNEQAIEIPSEFLILSSLPRQKASDTAASIRRWAKINDVSLDHLEEREGPKATAVTGHPAGLMDGVEAVRRMIALIPEGERSEYQLPLNLLGRLLLVR
jgi:hypothetical protein